MQLVSLELGQLPSPDQLLASWKVLLKPYKSGMTQC